MKKFFSFFAAVLLSVSVTSGVMAQDDESVGARLSEFVTIGGQMRPRYEILNDFDMNQNIPDNNNMVYMRTRLNFDFDITKNVSARIELQDNRRWGDFRDGPAGVTGPNAPRLVVGSNSSNLSDVGDITLREGYIYITDIWNHWDVKAGRQAIIKGDERVFGDLDWHSFGGITHDAEIVTFRPTENQSWDFIAIAVAEGDNLPTAGGNATNNADQDAYLYSIYGDIKVPFLTRFQPYVVYQDYDSGIAGILIPQTVRAENIAFGSNNDDYHAVTYGLLLSGEFADRWDWNFEGNYQTGDFGVMSLSAHMIHGKLGFETRLKHWDKIAVSYDIYSGDENGTDADMNTYQPIFPSFHEHIGRMAWFGMKNLNRWRVALNGDLVKDWRWRFDWHHFLRDQGADHFWENDNSRWFGGGANFSSTLANEFDIELSYPMNDNVKYVLSASFFNASDGMEQAASASGRQPENAFNYISQVTVDF